ncbi:hypothetical protein E3N88_15957 [Mikania micrantha]|uniref:Uncharacterized protein n=1 Tax=Mikania micrantha TaxID=192012 RepID=A0A5N6NY98_9ASTR|nr:hypothetical protein E3N88_15957 [Mikania micrantha]
MFLSSRDLGCWEHILLFLVVSTDITFSPLGRRIIEPPEAASVLTAVGVDTGGSKCMTGRAVEIVSNNSKVKKVMVKAAFLLSMVWKSPATRSRVIHIVREPEALEGDEQSMPIKKFP